MSSQEIDAPRQNEGANGADRDNDAVASKLSNELNNWRRKRTNGRPRHSESPMFNNHQSDSARTIKLRGHETLVVRKSKLAKPTHPSS
jgi:hypothetical protein